MDCAVSLPALGLVYSDPRSQHFVIQNSCLIIEGSIVSIEDSFVSHLHGNQGPAGFL